MAWLYSALVRSHQSTYLSGVPRHCRRRPRLHPQRNILAQATLAHLTLPLRPGWMRAVSAALPVSVAGSLPTATATHGRGHRITHTHTDAHMLGCRTQGRAGVWAMAKGSGGAPPLLWVWLDARAAACSAMGGAAAHNPTFRWAQSRRRAATHHSCRLYCDALRSIFSHLAGGVLCLALGGTSRGLL